MGDLTKRLRGAAARLMMNAADRELMTEAADRIEQHLAQLACEHQHHGLMWCDHCGWKKHPNEAATQGHKSFCRLPDGSWRCIRCGDTFRAPVTGGICNV